MKEDKRLARNEQMLEECFPWFRNRLASVIEVLQDQKIRPRIQQAWRSPAEQLEAFNTGHSKLKFGYHNATGPNGEKQALAVDILDDDAPMAPSTKYLLSLAIAARDHQLLTGLDWGLPGKLRLPITAAIAARDSAAKLGKIGWDPCHIEITGLSVADVKAGVRPKGR
jgi:hypothetical protein